MTRGPELPPAVGHRAGLQRSQHGGKDRRPAARDSAADGDHLRQRLLEGRQRGDPRPAQGARAWWRSWCTTRSTAARARRSAPASSTPPVTSSSCRTPTWSTIPRNSPSLLKPILDGQGRRRVRVAVPRRRAPRALLLALRGQQPADAPVEHVDRPEPDRHGNLLQDGAGAADEVAGAHDATGSASSRNSPPGWPRPAPASGRCRSPTPAAPTPRARRSAGRTASPPSSTSSASTSFPPSAPREPRGIARMARGIRCRRHHRRGARFPPDRQLDPGGHAAPGYRLLVRRLAERHGHLPRCRGGGRDPHAPSQRQCRRPGFDAPAGTRASIRFRHRHPRRGRRRSTSSWRGWCSAAAHSSSTRSSRSSRRGSSRAAASGSRRRHIPSSPAACTSSIPARSTASFPPAAPPCWPSVHWCGPSGWWGRWPGS